MKTLKTLLPLLLVFLVAACGSEHPEAAPETAPAAAPAEAPADNHQHMDGTSTEAAAEPRMDDGTQVIEIEAGALGFKPARVALQGGVPARLVFTRTADSACLEQVEVPEYDIAKTDLPLNQAVDVEFTPLAGGTFSFQCGMEMQQGTLVVRS